MIDKKNSKYFFGISFVALALGASIFIAIRDFTKDIEVHARMMEGLRRSSQDNHILNENLLTSKMAVTQSYDSLVAVTNSLLSHCQGLNENIEQSGISNLSQLRKDAARYCEIVREKASYVETFKSKNSLLKNSLSFLPVTISQISNLSLKNEAMEIYLELLRYSISGDPIIESQIKARLEKIESNRKRIRKTLSFIDNFIIHAKITLSVSQERHKAELEILSPISLQALNSLEKTYDELFTQDEMTSNYYRLALMGIALFLGMTLISIFIRLQRAKTALSEANVNLEAKVSQRTSELRSALVKLEENQQLLGHSAKMSALGEMAGSIAHEVNTPLAAIMVNAEMLLENLEENNPVTQKNGLENIIKIVERISKVILGLRRFSKDSSHDPKVDVNLREIISETLDLCQEKFKLRGILLEIEVKTERTVVVVPTQVSQVLLNLLNNSFDAISSVDMEKRWIRIDVGEITDGVQMSVTDCGNGIPLEHQNRIMQPFFTTKETGKGTGLGLSISKGIMQNNGGSLVYDASSAHTRFVMKFTHLSDQKVA